MFNDNTFFISTIPVAQNAVKNVLFRSSAIILNLVVYKFFAFLACRTNDYTSFLMFAENTIQKAFFLLDRKFNSQAILVLLFGVTTLAAGFYDTLIWALDDPGYLMKTEQVSAAKLSAQMLPNPAYITFISNPTRNVSDIDLQSTIGANLYASGLNFTLPGLVNLSKPEVVAPLRPVTSDIGHGPRIWLDNEGFAVGLDNTVTMNEGCPGPGNASVTPDGYLMQGWACPVANNDTMLDLQQFMGVPQVFWDLKIAVDIDPNRMDNPWYSLQANGETAMMKQVFGVTKGVRKHWFLQTMWKATMLGHPTLEDQEISDFVHRTWSNDTGSPDGVIPHAIQVMLNSTLEAKREGFGFLFGGFVQTNDTLLSTSSEFLIEEDGEGGTLFQVFRFVVSQISLVSSETLAQPVTPFEPCNLLYVNSAFSGIVRSTNCKTSNIRLDNNTYIPSGGPFLGEIDTSAVVIITDLLGDGLSDNSQGSLNQTGVDWYKANTAKIDQLLLSRAAIVTNSQRTAVMVNIIRPEAAISYMQLLLILIPPFLFLLIFLVVKFFHARRMASYFENSFLVAVLATTHVSTEKCVDGVGYVRQMPELALKRTDGHVVLKTPFGGTISNVEGENVGGMIFEPLILKAKQDKEGDCV